MHSSQLIYQFHSIWNSCALTLPWLFYAVYCILNFALLNHSQAWAGSQLDQISLKLELSSTLALSILPLKKSYNYIYNIRYIKQVVSSTVTCAYIHMFMCIYYTVVCLFLCHVLFIVILLYINKGVQMRSYLFEFISYRLVTNGTIKFTLNWNEIPRVIVASQVHFVLSWMTWSPSYKVFPYLLLS